MPERTVRAAPLTAAAFAPFGQVIEAGGRASAANQGRALRFDLAVDLGAHDARAGRLHAAIYRLAPSTLPFEVTVIERHALSPQLFFPNAGQRFLVCACPDDGDGAPDLDGLQALVGTGRQGIVWRAGTWHSPLAALDAGGDFFMQQWVADNALDCEERHLAAPVMITD